MAYYKVHIELWCGWDATSSSLDEIVENTHTGDAICIRQEIMDVVDRPDGIDDKFIVNPMNFCLLLGWPGAATTSRSTMTCPPIRRLGLRELNVIPF